MSRTKIKICGLFRPCDAEFVNSAQPDFAGFVFYEKSRRNVTPQEAQRLREAIRPEIRTAGVFVDASLERIAALYRDRTIGIVQLHGSEDDLFIERLRQMLPQAEIWKAFKIRSDKDLLAAERSCADRVLLDNGYGTGECFDWSLMKSISRPFILAGGLTPQNIPEAVSRFHPYAVDLSSGVEKDGLKDRDKIAAAVKAVKSTEEY